MPCVNNCGKACCLEEAYRAENRCAVCRDVVRTMWYCRKCGCMSLPEGPDASKPFVEICPPDRFQAETVCCACLGVGHVSCIGLWGILLSPLGDAMARRTHPETHSYIGSVLRFNIIQDCPKCGHSQHGSVCFRGLDCVCNDPPAPREFQESFKF
jgi:hypothetical protein